MESDIIAPEYTVRLADSLDFGWKVKIEYEAQSESGKPYRSEYWFILDKDATCVVNSFEIPLL